MDATADTAREVAKAQVVPLIAMTIDHWSPTPIFRQLADILEADIKAGAYAPGSPLPGELALSQRYGVSRGTVRRATVELRERGLVVTLPQRGTFVRPARPLNTALPGLFPTFAATRE